MKIDSEGSLICDMSKLENHLVQQQNTEQQNYRQRDVTELKEFLTKQSNKTPKTEYRDIRVSLDNHTLYDGTLHAAWFYINSRELVEHHHHNIVGMILQCLSSKDRVRLLHTKLNSWDWTLLHLITEFDKTGETTKTVLELVSEDQHYHLLSVQAILRLTPLHQVCRYKSAAVLKVIMGLVTLEQTRYELLQIFDVDGDTPLHQAAHRNATQAIRIIADSVSSHHLIHLLTITAKLLNHTPVQRAADVCNQEAEKLLQSCYTTALIDIASHQTDHTGKWYKPIYMYI